MPWRHHVAEEQPWQAISSAEGKLSRKPILSHSSATSLSRSASPARVAMHRGHRLQSFPHGASLSMSSSLSFSPSDPSGFFVGQELASCSARHKWRPQLLVRTDCRVSMRDSRGRGGGGGNPTRVRESAVRRTAFTSESRVLSSRGCLPRAGCAHPSGTGPHYPSQRVKKERARSGSISWPPGKTLRSKRSAAPATR